MAIPGLPFKLDAQDMGSFDMAGAMGRGQSLIGNLIEQQLNQAKTKRENAMANLPFGGANVPGEAGKIVGLEMIKQRYGSNSPQYDMAMKAFSLDQDSTRSRINYQNGLTDTLPVRALTPTGKATIEASNVKQGNSPTGKPWTTDNPAPASAQKLGGVYDLLLQKGSTDTDTRQRNLLATNIEKTINRINPDNLTRYAGFKGGMSKLGQEALAPFGKENKDYDDYSTTLRDAELLSTQVRNFYKDSIQPAMLQRLDSLTNPGEWKNNPELAKAQYKETAALLAQEMKTYRDAMEGTEVYKGQESSATSEPPMKGVSQGSKRLANGLVLPKFNSKAEFNAWYKAQDTTVKQAVKLVLKNGG